MSGRAAWRIELRNAGGPMRLRSPEALDVQDPRIEAAFAAVPREDFAGPPPWRIGSGGLFGLTSSDDPARLYEDVLVAIDAGRGINNGQPSLHAQAIGALALKEGETLLHIGAGAGYYTAILAELVGTERQGDRL